MIWSHVSLCARLQDVGHELWPGGHGDLPPVIFPRHGLLPGQNGVRPPQVQSLGQPGVEVVGNLQARNAVSIGGQQSLYRMSY